MALPFAALGGYRNLQRYRQDYRDNVQRYHQEQLFQAVENRDQTKVFAEIHHGASLKCTGQHGETVLHMAVKKRCKEPDDQKKIIKILDVFLRQNSMNVNVKCKGGKTALHLAVRNGMIEVVDYLLKKGADLNIRDIRGNWMAHHMVEGEYEKYYELTKGASVPPAKLRPYYRESVHFLNWMLSKKIELDCVNKNLDTPLHVAARRNLLHILPVLIEYTQDVTSRDKDKKTALHLFLENKKGLGFITIQSSCYDESLIVDILKMMLVQGYSVNATDVHGNTALHSAIHQERSSLIEIMLKKFKKVNVCNSDGNTILHFLIDNCIDISRSQHKEESVEFVRALLAKGADIYAQNEKGYKPVHLAVMRIHPTILQILKDHGANLREPYNGGNLLHLLSETSSEIISTTKLEEVIGLLVSEGCDVNAKDQNGMTPIHLAVKSGRDDVIEALAKCGANVDARELSADRLTPLQMAVVDNYEHAINTLVKVGANANAKDPSGKTPLHLAMKWKTSMAETLLRLGAHVDVEDDEELLPLHYAIKEQNGVALPELLKFGTDINDIDTYRELINLHDPGYMLFAVLEHWIKMKAAGLPVAPGYQRLVSDDTYQEIYQECLKEVVELKVYKIGESTSLYDLLHMDWNFRCAYTANTALNDLIGSTLLETQFPKYHVLILANYHESVARQPLLEPAKDAWCELTNIFLPDVCVYRILTYLSNKELRVMISGLRDRSFRRTCNLSLNTKRRYFQ